MIKREISYTYWDEGNTILKERVSKLGNINHGLTITYDRQGVANRKILYKFGNKVKELFLFKSSSGDMVSCDKWKYCEYVQEGGKTILKEWWSNSIGVFLISEAETKSRILHGKKFEYFTETENKCIRKILQYKNGELEGTSYVYNENGEIISKVNYKNGLRHGEAFIIGSSMFDEGALTQGVRVLSGKSTNDKELVALYENGNILELYFRRFGVKTARVHESMIKEVFFSTSLP